MLKILLISLVLVGFLSAVARAETTGFNRAQIEADNSAFVSVEAREVETPEDLRSYAFGTISSDKSVEEMLFSEDAVEVSYKQKGHLLAFIPVTFIVRAVAKVDGTVEAIYPWYSSITIDNKKEVETELKIAVNTTLAAYKVGFVQAEGKSAHPVFSESEQAQVASAMQKVLKTRIDGK